MERRLLAVGCHWWAAVAVVILLAPSLLVTVTTPVILIYAHAQNGSTPTPTIAGLNSSNIASASENQHKIRHDPVFDTKKAEKKLRGFVEANKFAILG